ncbi:MAG: PleD family two-component system response regulator [Candidatus Methylacidiphilales bacterium]
MKILAIDDSPTLRKFISKHLTSYSADYTVLTAATGAEGVDMALRELPQLILLDYILPDFNGDEVCRRLLSHADTAKLPVILMSSSAPDIEKTEGQFGNIVRSMVKPFSPQLLCAGVSYVLKKEQDDKPVEASPSTPSPATSSVQPSGTPDSFSPPLFSGSTAYFDLFDVLMALDYIKADGRLELDLPSGQRLLYVRQGIPILCTTRQVDAYISGGELDIPEETLPYFEKVKKIQSETGHPVFLQMSADAYLPPEQGLALTHQYGYYTFADSWTEPAVNFRFQPATLPDYAPEKGAEVRLIDWITTSLRCVNAHSPTVKKIAHPETVLSFTSLGYSRVQNLSLTEEEVAFASQLGQGGVNVQAIAEKLNLQWHELCRLVFFFHKTRVMDIWNQPS